jgi:hypothetical protein
VPEPTFTLRRDDGVDVEAMLGLDGEAMDQRLERARAIARALAGDGLGELDDLFAGAGIAGFLAAAREGAQRAAAEMVPPAPRAPRRPEPEPFVVARAEPAMAVADTDPGSVTDSAAASDTAPVTVSAPVEVPEPEPEPLPPPPTTRLVDEKPIDFDFNFELDLDSMDRPLPPPPAATPPPALLNKPPGPPPPPPARPRAVPPPPPPPAFRAGPAPIRVVPAAPKVELENAATLDAALDPALQVEDTEVGQVAPTAPPSPEKKGFFSKLFKK